MKRASIFLRATAFFIDLLVLVLACLLIHVLSSLGYIIGAGGMYRGEPGLPLGFLYTLVGLFYFTYLTMNGAQTIGKRSMGIRVTKLDGEAPALFRSLWRTCCYLLSALPFFLGFILGFVIRGRSLHDFLAGTMVVEEE